MNDDATLGHRPGLEASTARVLYVLKRYPRLSETFIVGEIAALEAQGTEVGIDALLPAEAGPRHPDVDGVAAAVRYLPRRPRLGSKSVLGAHLRLGVRHPARWLGRAQAARRLGADRWRRFLQAGLVAERARREGWGHLHAHFATAAAEVAADAAALAGVTFTVTAHAKDIYAAEHAPALARRLAGAAAVVTVSEHNRNHLREVLGPVGPVVHHIPNGVHLSPVLEPKLAGPLLCVARLVAKKGVDVLLDAVAKLLPHYPELHVEIIGDGPLRADLEAQARAAGLDDHVTWRGALAFGEVAAAYERAAMIVLPCRIAPDGDRDGLPTVLVEAAARALPVVSTDVVGIRELVTPGAGGLLVPPDDPAALANAIEQLWVNPRLAAQLGAAGRARVAERFDPTRSAAQLAEVFATSMAAGRATGARP